MQYDDSFYAVDRIIDTVKKLEKSLDLNKLDPDVSLQWWDYKRIEQLTNLINALTVLEKKQYDNPKTALLFKEVPSLLEFLKKLKKDYSEDSLKGSKVYKLATVQLINSNIVSIIKHLEEWEALLEKKSPLERKGNLHLADIGSHQDNKKFWVKPEELNPALITAKHPYNHAQAERVGQMSNEELVSFNRNDPITGTRFITEHDFGTAPGSKLRVTEGHHRLFEIFRRYLFGKGAKEIKQDRHIEFVKAQGR